MSLSDLDSSLTELSDDEAYVPIATKKKKAAVEKNGYKLKDVLKPPRQTTYSTKTLYEQIVEGNIDLNPEYQRDVVWPDSKQTGLIDSLLRNFTIPPVIFALHVSEDGSEKRTCIDGKQRLTSIYRFMDGHIPHKDSRSSVKRYFKQTNTNKAGKLLPTGYKQGFSNKQIVCIEYMDISDDSEREIFRRVQLGVALTPAERMQAVSTPWSFLIRECVKRIDGEVSNRLDWSSSRGRDFQCLASVVYLIDKGLVSFTAPSTLEKWLERTTGPPKAFSEKIHDAITVFSVLLDDKKNDKVFFAPKVSPVEFIMVLYLIHEYMNTSTLQQLAAGIGKMRTDVRSKFQDIRNNSKCNKHMQAFIRDKFPPSLKTVPSGESAAIVAAKKAVAIAKKASASSKRKRDDPESSDDDDDMPLRTKSPVKKTPKNSTTAAKAAERAATASSLSSQMSTPGVTTTKPAASTPKTKAKPEHSPPVNAKVESAPTAGKPKIDSLARLKAISGRRKSSPNPPPSSATSITSAMSHLTTDISMAPPPPSTAASRSQTPVTMSPATNAPPLNLPGPSASASTGQIIANLQAMPHLQTMLANQSTHDPPTPGNSSQLSATQWPGQAPGPPQSAPMQGGGIAIPLQQHMTPAPPSSAPAGVGNQDLRMRSGSGAQLPPRPMPPGSQYDNPTGYRRDPMDIDTQRSNSGPSALPSASRYEDDRMDRARDSSRYDGDRYQNKHSQPPPTNGYRDGQRSPNSTRGRDGHRNSYPYTGPSRFSQPRGRGYNPSGAR